MSKPESYDSRINYLLQRVRFLSTTVAYRDKGLSITGPEVHTWAWIRSTHTVLSKFDALLSINNIDIFRDTYYDHYVSGGSCYSQFKSNSSQDNQSDLEQFIHFHVALLNHSEFLNICPHKSKLKMDADYSPGEEHELFTEWAFSQGVIANGVTPARFPGRGLGMIATREIKVGYSKLFPSSSEILRDAHHFHGVRKAK